MVSGDLWTRLDPGLLNLSISARFSCSHAVGLSNEGGVWVTRAPTAVWLVERFIWRAWQGDESIEASIGVVGNMQPDSVHVIRDIFFGIPK